jgi:hypothetical protein
VYTAESVRYLINCKAYIACDVVRFVRKYEGKFNVDTH